MVFNTFVKMVRKGFGDSVVWGVKVLSESFPVVVPELVVYLVPPVDGGTEKVG